MNTTEHIVEMYYRMVKNCFTMTDIKIIGGNNRQIDLLAVSLSPRTVYHVETTVTHVLHWQWDTDDLIQKVGYKFFGTHALRDGTSKRTDIATGKTYIQQINNTYESLGITPDEVTRVMCVWVLNDQNQAEEVRKGPLAHQYLLNRFELLSFRDVVIPGLKEKTLTSNYEDDILRTFSLLSQQEEQNRIK